MSHLVLTTDADFAEYGLLPVNVRLEMEAWHNAFMAVTKPHTQALKKVAAEMGISYERTRAKFYAWLRADKDWRVCVNWAKAGRPSETVNEEFLAWFLNLAGKHQRNTMAAWRVFARSWKNGEAVPGLDNSLPRHRIPDSCSYKNLSRHLEKKKTALTAMRRGLGAAKPLMPMVFTSRANLWVGGQKFIDDVWHDNFVTFNGQLVRVLQLSVQDCFSGAVTSWGCKPRWEKADGSHDQLKESYARLVLASDLYDHGYSPRGTTIFAEHGTAAVSELVERILARYTTVGGRPLITVERSGITGEQQALLGIGKGKGKGNFRHKSHLESLHNLFHNELQALPAQTGKDVDHRPEFTHGQLREESDLLRVAKWFQRVAPHRVAMLQPRLLQYHSQFLPLLAATFDAINRRGEDPDIWTHELQGWHEAGHVIAELRFSAETDQWLDSNALDRMEPAAREAFLALARTRGDLLRDRKLSPKEVWTPGRKQLVKLPDIAIAEMLGEDFAREERVKGSYFTFQDADLAPEPLRFEARIARPDGREEELDGDTFKLLVNPFNLSAVFVHDAKGRFLGTARRDVRANRADTEALEEKFKRVAVRGADQMVPLRQAHAAELAAETRRLNANADLVATTLREQGIQTPAQKKRLAQPEAEVPEVDEAAMARRRAQALEENSQPAEVAWQG